MNITNIADRFCIDKPEKFRLSDYDPADCCGLSIDKNGAKAMLAEGIEQLSKLQDRLYAADRWSVLIVLQAMDAAGKDSLIKHVMSGLNPQGVAVTSFKAPSYEELSHNFLWRVGQRLPANGRIGIFNRSHYEEVLSVRVRPELIEHQRLPKECLSKDLWDYRLQDIRAFERHLARNGTIILKFFLHISKNEQRKRFLDRIEMPGKRWKFSLDDVADRKLWDKYMAAYEDAIRQTSRPEAPWYVVPADNKWFSRLVVADAVVQRLKALNLEFPKVTGEAFEELKKVELALKAEK